MKNNLTTGTWQDNIWCPINIILLCTSDACTHQTIMHVYLDSMDMMVNNLDNQLCWDCWPDGDEPFKELDLNGSEWLGYGLLRRIEANHTVISSPIDPPRSPVPTSPVSPSSTSPYPPPPSLEDYIPAWSVQPARILTVFLMTTCPPSWPMMPCLLF